MTDKNQIFTCIRKPDGLVQASDFATPEAPYPQIEKDGEFIVKADFLSVDPYLRAAMQSPDYTPGPLSNFIVGTVVESKNPKYPVGSAVQAIAPIAKYVKLTGEEPTTFPVPAPHRPRSEDISILGMPGRTAYFGVKYGLSVKTGDVVVVSGAAGIVGSAAGQIAKLLGAARVIGFAGSDAKCETVTSKYGFDACYNYKTYNTKEKVVELLRKECPKGVDCYFDNVGDHVSEAIYDVTAYCARIAICGQIAQYNNKEGPRMIEDFLFKLVYKQVRVQGIIYSYYMEQGLMKEANDAITQWLDAGKLVYDETVLEGFDQLPNAFCGLYSGANTGKMMVKP